MKITLTINGKPVEATVSDEDINAAMGEPIKKTGYERVPGADKFYAANTAGKLDERVTVSGDSEYSTANYYSDKAVAMANLRADMLIRRLRRFSAEHGGCPPPNKPATSSAGDSDYTITFLPSLGVHARSCFPRAGTVFFKTEEAAKAAIEEFSDELRWYFTEYDPMPKGWWND